MTTKTIGANGCSVDKIKTPIVLINKPPVEHASRHKNGNIYQVTEEGDDDISLQHKSDS